VHAFAHLTIPEIKAGLLAVIVFGAAIVALYVAVAMLQAAARAVAGRLARLGRAGTTLIRHQSTELAAEHTG